MVRGRSEYVCQQCGSRSTKWLGRCPDCGEWNSYTEQAARAGNSASARPITTAPRPLRLREVEVSGFERIAVPMQEFSRVLGGGIVRGSLVLVGGDPGIGKSTLLMQVSDGVARTLGDVLYVSGEESLPQLGLRARRLGLNSDGLLFAGETDVNSILQLVQDCSPHMLVVDSIQCVYDPDVESSPGSVSQLRECTQKLMRLAKESGIPVFLVGHVTKEGAIAGPKVLEHMVDTVLYMEGERFQAYRLLRAVKNRFGPTHEVGVFEMQGDGLAEVANPSAIFLAERLEAATGCAVVPTMEGTRPLLVEIQALASRTTLAIPRRSATGVDFGRLMLVTAVLSRRLGLSLYEQDIYVNVVGGLKIDEPAADLGMALAIVSSVKDRPLDPDLVVVGEVGLTGELRSVGQLERRLKEAAKLGFRRALVPRSAQARNLREAGLEVQQASTLVEAVGLVLRG